MRSLGGYYSHNPEQLYTNIESVLLLHFLPPDTREAVHQLLQEADIKPPPPPTISEGTLALLHKTGQYSC